METKNFTDFTEKFSCNKCDVICRRKSEWERHLLTRKHRKGPFGNVQEENFTEPKKHKCICGKIYVTHSGLWKHNKICKYVSDVNCPGVNKEDNFMNIILKENSEIKNMVIEVVKQNHELNKQNNDLQKQMLDAFKNIQPSTIHTNSHNKTFNLQFFLNEQCKDAMNIMDFVNSVTLQLSDLENVSKVGYVEGISNIMIQKLNEMDIYKRPVHCSDAKRETMYVKDKDKWEKEGNDHSILRKAIKYISKKNSDLLIAWSNKYPASKNITSTINEQYMRMIKQAMGGCGEITDNEDKIIKKIAKIILIDKE